MEYFDTITFHHISREDNQLADALATLSSMFKVNQRGELPTIKMKSHKHPAYCSFIEKNQTAIHGILILSNISRTKNILKGPLRMINEC